MKLRKYFVVSEKGKVLSNIFLYPSLVGIMTIRLNNEGLLGTRLRLMRHVPKQLTK